VVDWVVTVVGAVKAGLVDTTFLETIEFIKKMQRFYYLLLNNVKT